MIERDFKSIFVLVTTFSREFLGNNGTFVKSWFDAKKFKTLEDARSYSKIVKTPLSIIEIQQRYIQHKEV